MTEENNTEEKIDVPNDTITPPVQPIAYSDFAKLEIKIGTITAVEIVPEADKLLKLTVDIGGGETRQIVSGIRTFFTNPQELIGKQCPFLTNLEPRVIRGLESQGMILAAGNDETFSLLHPSNTLPAGTEVH
jgi:methionyl-tRNA synthetase